jgi:predicted small lipoprotein YifL
MKRLTILPAILAVMFLLSGCGQSGPLYIPGDPSQMAVPPFESSTDEDKEEEIESSETSEMN